MLLQINSSDTDCHVEVHPTELPYPTKSFTQSQALRESQFTDVSTETFQLRKTSENSGTTCRLEGVDSMTEFRVYDNNGTGLL